MATSNSKKSAFTKGSVDISAESSSYIDGVLTSGVTGKTLSDGSILYNWKESGSFLEINFNGIAASYLNIEEARVWPDGYGYILTQKQSHQDDIIVLPDGRKLNYTLYGYIEIL